MNMHARVVDAPETKTVPLDRLRFGDEHPEGNVNVRRTKSTPEEDAQLRASIAADGILQSLLCTTYHGNDCIYVIAGNRRLAQAREVQTITEAPVILRHALSVEQAIALGLAEDMPKVPTHPVDRYEAFALLITNEDLKPADVAERFGVSKTTVERALRLGRVPAKIRQAAKSGEISERALQLFTLAKDEKQAEKVFDRLKKGNALREHDIRSAFVVNQGDAQAHVNFIGLDSFIADGGKVISDLFGSDTIVVNPELAADLAHAKLRGVCAGLVSEGWGWAEIEAALPADHRSWREVKVELKPTKEESKRLKELDALCDAGFGDEYDRAVDEANALELQVRLRAYTPEDRAKSGCVVLLDDDGRLRIAYGILKPVIPAKAGTQPRASAREKKNGKDGDASPSPLPEARKGRASTLPQGEGEETAELSNSHKVALGITLTEAASIALREQPGLAVMMLLCGVACEDGIGHAPIRVRVSGLGREQLSFSETGIAANIARWKDLPAEKLLANLAQVAAASLAFNYFDPAIEGGGAIDDEDIAAICNALDPEKMSAALKKRFDAEDYFKKAPKAFALSAIADVCGPDVARQHEKKPKGDIVKFALANISGTAWLPKELRTAHYAAPKTSPSVAPARDTSPTRGGGKKRAKAAAAKHVPPQRNLAKASISKEKKIKRGVRR